MGLIYSKVNKHLISHPNQVSHKDDLVQEASLALIKAIEEFDVNSKNIFNAYAIKCITGAILNAYNPVRQKSIVDGKGEYKFYNYAMMEWETAGKTKGKQERIAKAYKNLFDHSIQEDFDWPLKVEDAIQEYFDEIDGD